jgi:transcriptional regulator with XRE-family HTH domain
MHNVELEKLGNILRQRRELLGLTQVELAIKCQVDRNYIGMLERGERNPSYLSLLKVVRGLDITLGELLKT